MCARFVNLRHCAGVLDREMNVLFACVSVAWFETDILENLGSSLLHDYQCSWSDAYFNLSVTGTPRLISSLLG